MNQVKEDAAKGGQKEGSDPFDAYKNQAKEFKVLKGVQEEQKEEENKM